MKLFNIDLHISVIADIKDIFKRIRPEIDIIDWSLSGHTWVFKKSRTKVNVLTQESWSSLNMELIQKFQENYDTFLQTMDGFIVCHPNSFALLFEKYNKPIIVINSCRYDMPYCWNKDTTMLSELNSCFSRLQHKNLLTFISNNQADNKYFLMANPLIKTQIIPSLCQYTDMSWDSSKTYDKFLVYTGKLPSHELLVTREKLGHAYSWQSLMNFRGIIHIPYEASTMSIFEQISSGIPLFFPTKSFLKELWQSGQKKQVNYWNNPPAYLSETKFDEFWIEKADYYEIEGSYYFNSFDELFKMLDTFADTLYTIRINFIQKRNEKVYDNFKKILSNFPSN